MRQNRFTFIQIVDQINSLPSVYLVASLYAY